MANEEDAPLRRVPLVCYDKDRKINIGEALVDPQALIKANVTDEEDLVLEVTAGKFTIEKGN